jgi:hypothetical protein
VRIVITSKARVPSLRPPPPLACPALNQLQLLSFLRSIDEPDSMDGAVRPAKLRSARSVPDRTVSITLRVGMMPLGIQSGML